MAVSTMWIKNNMFSCGQYERQLTEAELKVQRSLLKLSIPDWYLNKRSSPPKILNNATPIEFRPPSWKNFGSKKDSSLISRSSNLSVSDASSLIESPNTTKIISKNETYKIPHQQKSPEAKHRQSPSKYLSVKKEKPFDTTIPEVKLSTNISKTFPKMSPSRKIQNINIVFQSEPRAIVTPIQDPIDTKSTYSSFAPKKQQISATRKNDTDLAKKNGTFRTTPTKTCRENSFLPLENTEMYFMTPKAKGYFRVSNSSALKFSPANLFSSTIIEETPKAKKVLSRGILEKSSIFESSSSTYTVEKSEDAPRLKKLSQSLLEKTSIFEDSTKMGQSPSSVEIPKKIPRSKPYLEKNIRSIDPIIFEKDHTALSTPALPVVRELVKRLEVSRSSVRNPDEKSHLTWKSKRSLQEKKPDPESSLAPVQRRTNLDSKNHLAAFALRETRTNVDGQSPCTRFLTSKRKSVDLENVVKSKQPPREKNVVRGIIETLTEKLSKASTRRNEVVEVHQNFVRKLVDALEKGDAPVIEETLNERIDEDTGSCSESEAKSCATSVSLKDTDSSSDSDQRSPTLSINDNDRTFVCGTPATEKSLEDEVKSRRDEDSVYWIPVSRCKLPRTSSLLSLTSKLSITGQSPCVSPIRSDSESETSPVVPWGATFKKTNALSRKLFRIDETVVIDSGYSDRSDRSAVGCAITDSTWSEDIQNDSGSEIRSTRMKRSSRRKTIVGHTFRVCA